MTCEVVLLNKDAIVIAADSAVTVGRDPNSVVRPFGCYLRLLLTQTVPQLKRVRPIQRIVSDTRLHLDSYLRASRSTSKAQRSRGDGIQALQPLPLYW
jgi:hypothetical protein